MPTIVPANQDKPTATRPIVNLLYRVAKIYRDSVGLRGGGRERLAIGRADERYRWDEFYPRFTELHNLILNRFHKKIDYAMMDVNSPACLKDKQYWEGWNAGLNWAHRIVDGDKSAD